MSPRFRAVSILALLFFAFYELFLSKTGYLERQEWKRKLEEAHWELERLREENKNLLERKKRSLDELTILENEAKKYYFVHSELKILKFSEPEALKTFSDRRMQWLNWNEEMGKEDRLAPLEVLRVFHISFSFFVILAVFFHLSPKKEGVSEDISEINRT